MGELVEFQQGSSSPKTKHLLTKHEYQLQTNDYYQFYRSKLGKLIQLYTL